MTNKVKQEERMKEYFIGAAKEILRGEGLKSISARNIAEKAGYSYATLYNYFKDIKSLIFLCIKDFQDECRDFINNETTVKSSPVEMIQSIIKAYIKYFIQYPGIFELFYLEKGSQADKRSSSEELIYNFTDILCQDEWDKCLENKIFNTEEIFRMKNEIRYITPGMLLFYLNRNNPDNYNEFIKIVNDSLNSIFRKNS